MLPNTNEHYCFIFYPIEAIAGSATPTTTLADLAKLNADTEASHPWLTEDALASINDKRGQWPIWETSTFKTSNDLYPHIKRLLGDKVQDQTVLADSTQQAHAQTYSLSAAAKKLLQGKRLAYSRETPAADRQPKPLGLHLTKAAQRRIAKHLPAFTATFLPVVIQNVTLVVFKTGCAFLLLELCFGKPATPVHPYLMVEGLYRLSHFNRLTWNPPAQPQSPNRDFALETLVYSLLGLNPPEQSQRFYSSTYIQFHESPQPPALQRLLLQLSRRYTDDYSLLDEMVKGGVVQHFQNVRHRFALEGCATCVDLGEYQQATAPEFLQHFAGHTYRTSYLPVILLAYHEFTFLLTTNNAASLWPESEEDETALQHMVRLRLQISSFMLCYRFSYVSHISMHNAVNQVLRQSLGLDKMLQEVERDTTQIDSFLELTATRYRERHNRDNERRFRWAAVIGTAGIAWFSSHRFLVALLEVELINGRKIEDWLNWVSPSLMVFAAATLVAGIAAWVVNMKSAPYRGKQKRSQG